MKKFLLLLLFIPSFSFAFSDVSQTNHQFEAIRYLKEIGAVKGFSDGTFGIQKSVSRAEFLKMLIYSDSSNDLSINLSISDIENCTFDTEFPDVRNDDWFKNYVCYAKNENWINGYEDGFFRPHNSVTFAEAAKMLIGPLDVEKNSQKDWYTPFIEAAQNNNISPKNVSNPHQILTRGDIAEMLWKKFNKEESRTTENYRFYESKNFPLSFYFRDEENDTSSFVFETEKKILIVTDNIETLGTEDCPPEYCFLSEGKRYAILDEMEIFEKTKTTEEILQGTVISNGKDIKNCEIEKLEGQAFSEQILKEKGISKWNIRVKDEILEREEEKIESEGELILHVFPSQMTDKYCWNSSDIFFTSNDSDILLRYKKGSGGMSEGVTHIRSISFSSDYNFANCLTQKGAIFYGTEWCPYCKNQKAMFGSDIEKINYIDCDKEREKCKEEGITGYPTWKFSDNSSLIGTQSLETLGKKTGCNLDF